MPRTHQSPPHPYTAVAVALSLAAACAAAAPKSGAEKIAAEIQINLCSEPDDIVRALRLQPRGAAPREVWYFDSPGLELYRQGLVFRLRLTGAERELTLKVADQDCARVDPALIPPKEGKCEYDLHGADFKGAVSLSRDLDERSARGLIDGSVPLGTALSAAQTRYLREGKSVWPLPADIRRVGPALIRMYRPEYRPGDRRFDVEVWQLPDGARYIEISQKADAKEALRRAPELTAELTRAGVAVCADQSSQAGAKLRALMR